MAREKALACRRLLLEGFDPIETRRSERAAAVVAIARAVSFRLSWRPYKNRPA